MKQLAALLTVLGLALCLATELPGQSNAPSYQARELYNDTITNALDSTYATVQVGNHESGFIIVQYSWNENISGTNGGTLYLQSAPTPSGPWVTEQAFTTDAAAITYHPVQGRTHWRVDAALTGTHTSYLGLWVGFYPICDPIPGPMYRHSGYAADTIAATALDSITSIVFPFATPYISSRTAVIQNTSPYADDDEALTYQWYVRAHTSAPYIALGSAINGSAPDATDAIPAVGSEDDAVGYYPFWRLDIEQSDVDTLAVYTHWQIRPAAGDLEADY